MELLAAIVEKHPPIVTIHSPIRMINCTHTYIKCSKSSFSETVIMKFLPILYMVLLVSPLVVVNGERFILSSTSLFKSLLEALKKLGGTSKILQNKTEGQGENDFF